MGKKQPTIRKHSGKSSTHSGWKRAAAMTVTGLAIAAAAVVAVPKITGSGVELAKSYLNPSCQVVKQNGFYDFSIQPSGSYNPDATGDGSPRMVRLIGLAAKNNGQAIIGKSIESGYTLGEGLGTGYNIGGGLILTAAHVVGIDNTNMMYTDVLIKYGSTGNGVEVGKLVAWDKASDIALVEGSNTNFSGIRLKAPVSGEGVDALVIDSPEDSVKFQQPDVKLFPFKTETTSSSKHGKNRYSSQAQSLTRPGMSGSPILSGTDLAGIRTNTHETTISYALNGSVSGDQTMEAANVTSVIRLLKSYCKNSNP